jgi:hypothetical protein
LRKTLKICIRRANVTGSETASVFEQRDADHYEHIAEVPTAYRVKSSIFVPELKRLYVAVSGKESRMRNWSGKFTKFNDLSEFIGRWGTGKTLLMARPRTVARSEKRCQRPTPFPSK